MANCGPFPLLLQANAFENVYDEMNEAASKEKREFILSVDQSVSSVIVSLMRSSSYARLIGFEKNDFKRFFWIEGMTLNQFGRLRTTTS